MKQVIVIRKDLQMGKGKMCAQAAHASVSAYVNCSPWQTKPWTESGAAKITVAVNSEEELLAIYEQASRAQLPVSLIRDAGLTQFSEPTYTTVGIGPAKDEEIDLITGTLKLL
jgi:PTH2 family peptidyl-tRNA hydrolase